MTEFNRFNTEDRERERNVLLERIAAALEALVLNRFPTFTITKPKFEFEVCSRCGSAGHSGSDHDL